MYELNRTTVGRETFRETLLGSRVGADRPARNDLKEMMGVQNLSWDVSPSP